MLVRNSSFKASRMWMQLETIPPLQAIGMLKTIILTLVIKIPRIANLREILIINHNIAMIKLFDRVCQQLRMKEITFYESAKIKTRPSISNLKDKTTKPIWAFKMRL